MAGLSCLIVAIVALVVLVDAENFCDRQRLQCKDGPHTMCTYRYAGPGRQCRGYVKQPLTSQEKKEIVYEHNQYRRKVASGRQPGQPAGYIPDLKWDEDLAVFAQRWADQCADSHDLCRNTEKYGWVGQNIAGGGSTAGFNHNMRSLVKMWFDEVKDFNPRYVHSYQYVEGGPKTGHYTQLVWGETTHVGCGIARHLKTGPDSTTGQWYTFKWTTLICNYGPGGNVENRVIYRTR